MLGSALGADTLYDVVDFSGGEALGQVDVRYQVFVQAVGVLADFTIEVAVGLFFVAVSVVVADAVFVWAAAVVYTVYQVVLVKEHEGAEDDRLVDAVELPFQRAQAECVTVTGNGFIDEQSGRGGTNAGWF